MNAEKHRLRVLVADDEFLARQRIIDLLHKEGEGVELVGEAKNGLEAVELVRTRRPDLLFLDVQMPGKSGLEVAAELGAEEMPVTIFVTAFDQHAVRAFELAAVDYLVKPFDDERFEQALHRAQRTLALQEAGRMSERLLAELQRVEGTATTPPPANDYLERIAVESRGQMRVVPVAQIDYITASGPYAELHVEGRTYLIRERMQVLELRLDPAVFFRIHRSAIVRLDRIDTLRRASGGDYAVRLKDGVELSLSRGRREELEARLGL